jgi:hypothetical protein
MTGRRVLRSAVAIAVLGAVVAAVVSTRTSPGHDRGACPGVAAGDEPSKARRLLERRTGSLAAPLQDAAGAALDGRRAMLLGGLTADGTSTDRILVADSRSARLRTALPRALHDSAAVRLGRWVYLFGGGTGARELDSILRIDPYSGASAEVGRLPAPSSDQSAATVGRTAYVVGGYTGNAWLDTIVAWRPGTSARVVARLPAQLRYAAVAAVGDRIVIAGGSEPSGLASRAVLVYEPATNRVACIGNLPAPTTHAAAASLGGVAYIVGGRGDAIGTPTARIVGIDLAVPRVRAAGRLSSPRSDVTAVALGKRILLAGGLGRTGTGSALSELVSSTREDSDH